MRKHEIFRSSSNTKLSKRNVVRTVRVRGGNVKFRALRVCQGNFSLATWGFTIKTRILGVVYNATSNQLVRTNTIVKSAIVVVDGSPFRQKLWSSNKPQQIVSTLSSKKKQL